MNRQHSENQRWRTRRVVIMSILALWGFLVHEVSAQAFDDIIPPVTIGNTVQSLATGDLNGDGIDDIAAAPGIGNSVHVFIGPLHLGDVISAPGSTGDFGHALAVGDIDNDGLSEIVVGSPSPTGGTVYIYRYSIGGSFSLWKTISAPSLPIPGSNLTSISAFGSSVAITPDMNGNTKPQVLIGAPKSKTIDGFERGAVFAYDVSGNGTPTRIAYLTPGMHLALHGGMARFGKHIEGGDFNGDGKGDVAVHWQSLSHIVGTGASGGFAGSLQPGGSQVGLPRFHFVYAYKSLNQSSPLHIDNSLMSTLALHPFGYGGPPYGNPLFDMDNPGDLDGDGADDLIVGDPYRPHPQTGTKRVGAVHLWFPDHSQSNPYDTHVKTVLSPFQQKKDYFGTGVSGLGDLNGDGIPDLVGLSVRSIELISGGQPSLWKAGSTMGSQGLNNSGSHRRYEIETGDFNGDGWMDLVFEGTSTSGSELHFVSIASTATSTNVSSPSTGAPSMVGGIATFFLNLESANVGDTVHLIAADGNFSSSCSRLSDPNGPLSLPFFDCDPYVLVSLADPLRLFGTNVLSVPVTKKLTSYMDLPDSLQPGTLFKVAFFTYSGTGGQSWTSVSNTVSLSID